MANAVLAAAEARADRAQADAMRASEKTAASQTDLANAQERIATLEQQVSTAKAALEQVLFGLTEAEAKARRASETVSSFENGRQQRTVAHRYIGERGCGC